jgi:hypothetical protein
MEASMTPGMKSSIHRHSGPKAWYAVPGRAPMTTPAAWLGWTRLLLLIVVVGCQSDTGMLGVHDFPVSFDVSNGLIAPVTVFIDGAPYAVLGAGGSIPLTVSSRSQWLTWTSAKPKDAAGELIPDDIGEVRVSVAGINHTLEIGNVIADQPYFTARIHNDTSMPVSIGVFDGSQVSCAGALPAASNGVTGFVQIGYYRLLSGTQLRAYRDPSHCSGSYVSWSSSDLAGYQAKTGLVSVILAAVP